MKTTISGVRKVRIVAVGLCAASLLGAAMEAALAHGPTPPSLKEVAVPSTPGLEDIVIDKDLATVLGKAFFWDTNLGSDGIWRLVAYIRSISRQDAGAVPGDASHGSTLFWNKGQCGRCHAIGDRGSRLGPDLTRIGRQRSLQYLRVSVTDPDDDIAPGYSTLTVVTRDGKTIRGLEKGLDNFSAQLTDLSGKFYSFERSEVKSMKSETRSLMPSYARTFSEDELTDLFAYLASLKGVRP